MQQIEMDQRSASSYVLNNFHYTRVTLKSSQLSCYRKHKKQVSVNYSHLINTWNNKFSKQTPNNLLFPGAIKLENKLPTEFKYVVCWHYYVFKLNFIQLVMKKEVLIYLYIFFLFFLNFRLATILGCLEAPFTKDFHPCGEDLSLQKKERNLHK